MTGTSIGYDFSFSYHFYPFRLENKLNNNLMKQKERFTKELDELTTNKNESMIDVMQSELEEVDDKITDKKIKMQNIERCAISCMTIH